MSQSTTRTPRAHRSALTVRAIQGPNTGRAAR